MSYADRRGSLRLSLDGARNDGIGCPADCSADNILPSVEQVEGARGANAIRGSSDDNRIEVSDPLGGHKAGDARLHGLAGDDRLLTASGDDAAFGGSGKDIVRTGAGADRLNGGAGRDRCAGGTQADRAAACEKVSGVP